MAVIAVYPGSFDPVTFGHLDIMIRSSALFDELHVVVVHNPAKQPRFSSEERVSLIQQVLREADQPNLDASKIKVTNLDAGLLVDYCRMVNSKLIIKGIRVASDYDYELPMAVVNGDLANVETLFLPANAFFNHVSSSLVKQVFDLGGKVENYVPNAVVEALERNTRNREVSE